MESRGYIGPTQTKIKFTHKLLVQIYNTKFHWNPFSSFGTETCRWAEKVTPLCILCIHFIHFVQKP